MYVRGSRVSIVSPEQTCCRNLVVCVLLKIRDNCRLWQEIPWLSISTGQDQKLTEHICLSCFLFLWILVAITYIGCPNVCLHSQRSFLPSLCSCFRQSAALLEPPTRATRASIFRCGYVCIQTRYVFSVVNAFDVMTEHHSYLYTVSVVCYLTCLHHFYFNVFKADLSHSEQSLMRIWVSAVVKSYKDINNN